MGTNSPIDEGKYACLSNKLFYLEREVRDVTQLLLFYNIDSSCIFYIESKNYVVTSFLTFVFLSWEEHYLKGL